MLIDLPKLDTPHPTSLWDYLVDIPYMPSKADRERIEKLAKNRQQPHRVRIWDYFFHPQREDVGKSVRAELSQRQAEAARLQAEGQQLLQQSSDALASFEHGWRNEGDLVEAQLQEIRTDTASREKRGGWKSVIAGILLTEGSVYVVIRYYIASMVEGDLGAACALVLLSLLALVAFIAGVVSFFTGRRRLTPESIQTLIASRQKDIQERWFHRSLALTSAMDAERQRIAYAREMLDRLVPHIHARIVELERLLRHILIQIPPPPTATEVQEWLLADLEELRADGAERLAIDGDLEKLRTAENPLEISGPAEIQATDLIPPSYSDPDRKKYLRARRFGTTSGGPVRHFGVFYFELLFVGRKTLARYSVFFDFIRGDRIRESAPQQHYADVVTMDMRKEYRKIVLTGDDGNPREVELEREPSMILTLKGGETVTITLPSNEYFERVGDTSASNIDATNAAENALRAIALRVKEAKKNLEVGQIAKMREA